MAVCCCNYSHLSVWRWKYTDQPYQHRFIHAGEHLFTCFCRKKNPISSNFRSIFPSTPEVNFYRHSQQVSNFVLLNSCKIVRRNRYVWVVQTTNSFRRVYRYSTLIIIDEAGWMACERKKKTQEFVSLLRINDALPNQFLQHTLPLTLFARLKSYYSNIDDIIEFASTVSALFFPPN